MAQDKIDQFTEAARIRQEVGEQLATVKGQREAMEGEQLQLEEQSALREQEESHWDDMLTFYQDAKMKIEMHSESGNDIMKGLYTIDLRPARRGPGHVPLR